ALLPRHHAAAVEHDVDRAGAEPAGQAAVARDGRATALDVAEDADARLEARQGAHAIGDREHVTLLPALRHHDDAAPLAALPAPLELGAERVEVGRLLGDEHVLRPAGHAHPESDLAA